MLNHYRFQYQLQKNTNDYPTSVTQKLDENGCKFSQTWLIGILARYCIFVTRYWIFRGNKNVWRYRKVRLLRHIREKRGGYFTPMGLLPHVALSRAGISNYIPQYLWDVITCPCPWYLLLVRKSSYMFNRHVSWLSLLRHAVKSATYLKISGPFY